MKLNVMFSMMYCILIMFIGCNRSDRPRQTGRWIDGPQDQWPRITMINSIEYSDTTFPTAGCSFLLDTGEDTLAATAKHILTFFKSNAMNSVSFNGTLKSWRMFPKDSPEDVVVVDSLINEAPNETIDDVPPPLDWLLFTVRETSPHIQPLQFRTKPLRRGEPVYIVGWRYSDRNCPQVVYEGNFVESREGSIIISTKKLADNTMPGLSGSPVIDSDGRLIGLMSRKAGKNEEPSSIDYPREVIQGPY